MSIAICSLQEKEYTKMTLLDVALLPVVMICWLFISYDAVNRFCQKRGLTVKKGIGMKIWVVVGFAGGAYIMHLFNAL